MRISVRTQAIDALSGHFAGSAARVDRLPRVKFLTPMIVQTNDLKLGAFAILIEPMLYGKNEKFNNNMGFVKSQKRQDSLVDDLANLANLQLRPRLYVRMKSKVMPTNSSKRGK